MNKKIAVVVAIVVLILVIGGALLLAKMQKKSQVAEQNMTMSPKPTQHQNIFSSITDALTKQISLSCDFTTDEGVHITSYIKNGAVRADLAGKTADQNGSVIIKDKKIYFWNSSVAMMMDEPQITVTPGAATQSATSQEQNIMNNMEKYKQYCHNAIVSDNEFVPPNDRTFTDASRMIPSGIPTSGGNIPAIPSNYQQYMQQYQNKIPQGY